MIEMFCDRCGKKIAPDVNGGVRIRTANREWLAHLCADHQKEFQKVFDEFCSHGGTREVKPTLKLP